MGLLDATDDETQNAAISNGLLNFVAMANKKRPFMGLLAGLQGYEQTQASAKDRALRMAMEERKLAMEEQFKQAQIGEYQAQAQQRLAAIRDGEAKASEAGRIQSLVRGAGTVQPMEAVPMQDARGVTGERKTPDYTWLMQQGVPPELVKQLAESRNFGREEVARVIDTVGPDGMPVQRRETRFADQVGQDLRKPVENKLMNLGGKDVAYNPFALQPGQEFLRTVSPDAQLGANTTMRGQNMTDARAREKNKNDLNAVGKIEWKQDTQGNWIALPKEVNSRDPVTPITTTTSGKREIQSKNAIEILNEAEPLLKGATGSFVGAGVDIAGRVVGYGTPGAQDVAKLKALEGSLMMAQPRMEGPQSNLDTALYRQMAGQIGDPTQPASVKQAAAAQVRKLHEKYVGGASAGGGGKSVVRTGTKDGRKWVRYSDGSEGYGD